MELQRIFAELMLVVVPQVLEVEEQSWESSVNAKPTFGTAAERRHMTLYDNGGTICIAETQTLIIFGTLLL